jgi:hypothetical protein
MRNVIVVLHLEDLWEGMSEMDCLKVTDLIIDAGEVEIQVGMTMLRYLLLEVVDIEMLWYRSVGKSMMAVTVYDFLVRNSRWVRRRLPYSWLTQVKSHSLNSPS